MLRTFCVLGFAIALARPAHAEPNTTVMVEPLYLVIGMVDSTIEYEPTPHLGVAAIAGYGKPMFAASLYDLGAQVNYYPQRDFSALHIGAEYRVMWGNLSLPFANDTSKMDTDDERIVGAYVGWKWTASYGLTAVLQAGLGHIRVRGPDPMSQFFPVANFNAGWSF